jgi:hypothetical protein
VLARIARQNGSALSAARQTGRRVWPHTEAFFGSEAAPDLRGRALARIVDPIHTIRYIEEGELARFDDLLVLHLLESF